MSKYEERRAAPWGRDSHERHEPYEWHEPTDRPGPLEADHEQHAGNGTVNHRPDDQARADTGRDRAAADHLLEAFGRDADGTGDGLGAGRDRLLAALGGGGAGSGSGGGGEDLPGDGDGTPEGLGSDELALRRMLHQAVGDIEPREGSLDHLRRAVPARRARKRQAVVGMAAAALFIGTAIPALVHVSNATGSNADPSIAGQASEAQGGAGQGKGPDGGSSGSAGSAGTSKETGKGSQKGKEDKGKGVSDGATGGTNPSASAQTAPPCTAAQLSQVTATAGTPDSTGAVYGTFRITNTSTTSCTASGSDNVTAAPQGAADPTKITVVKHVTGDPATNLPDPGQEVTSLVLKPGAAYEVRFAWVPSETCPTAGSGTGGGTGASPDPSPTQSTSTSGGGSSPDSSGAAPQLMTEDGVADGSVTVSLTPGTGSATSSTTVANACAGTVYRTGMLAGS
ncbi:hypothetical protein ACFYZJ_21080 [Streptomyces sp. NPDC001848]|uniref:hypothetical protein n=1 Tax=Streptomyces sp. NPDC001848 TaxID=3364618 RepID=UPI0036A4EE67